MSDLIERLRDFGGHAVIDTDMGDACLEAADEIERLTEQKDYWANGCIEAAKRIAELEAGVKAALAVPANWGSESYDMIEILEALQGDK